MISNPRQVMIAATIIGVTTGLLLLIYTIFEETTGHLMTVAALSASAIWIVFRPQDSASRPTNIIIAYLTAAVIGVIIANLPLQMATLINTAIGLVAISAILLSTGHMHPPAVIYYFSFIYGHYGGVELILTLPAIATFFIILATVIFFMEQLLNVIIVFLGGSLQHRLPFDQQLRPEQLIDRIVPYAVVILLLSLLLQFLKPEMVMNYERQITVLDWTIIGLLISDLAFKFQRAQNWQTFSRKYWLELVAIIPFFVVFRSFQGAVSALEFISRGAIDIPNQTAQFLRILNPLARFPRLSVMLKYLKHFFDFDHPTTQTVRNWSKNQDL